MEIDKRLWLAAHAPQVPSWFWHVVPDRPPEVPIGWGSDEVLEDIKDSYEVANRSDFTEKFYKVCDDLGSRLINGRCRADALLVAS